MNNKNYTVYMHETPSGKKYVGITRDTVKSRWDSGWGYHNNPYFWNAIKKYGWKNIKHKILYTELTEQEAKEKEIELIAEMDLTNKNKGYNHSLGGGLGSPSNMKKIYMYDPISGNFLMEFNSRNDAEKYLGVNTNSLGRKRQCEYETRHGYMWRDEYFDKISTHNNSFEIMIIDRYSHMFITNFYKLESDFKYKGQLYKKSVVNKKCKNKDYIYKDIICCYVCDYMNMINNTISDFVGVYKIDKDTNIIIDAYPNYEKAALSVGGIACSISNCCRYKQKTAYGYKWESVGMTNGENIIEKSKYIEENYLYDENIDTLDFYIFKQENISLIDKD